ncbi:MAG: helix-turn-helix domain-containing protein [Candidatus Omnitrophota bacterium]
MGMIIIKKEVLESWLKNKSTPPRNFGETADFLGISQALFSYILSGKRQVTPNVLRKLCDLTGYDVGDLCSYDRTKEPTEDNEK